MKRAFLCLKDERKGESDRERRKFAQMQLELTNMKQDAKMRALALKYGVSADPFALLAPGPSGH